MLSVQQCRTILGNDCSLTDQELEDLREQLYGLANVAVKILPDQLLVTTNTSFANSPFS
jgi:hypothetical protein